MNWHTETCVRCKEPFAISTELYNVLRRQAESGNFYCPHRHRQHYVSGETEAQKLQREVNRLRQQAAEKDDQVQAERARTQRERDLRASAERQAAARKGQVTRLKNRAAAGVCPCCNRTFQDLARHMAGQHPEFVKTEEEA